MIDANCQYCYKVSGYYLGTTCPHCGTPFREVRKEAVEIKLKDFNRKQIISKVLKETKSF